jgi:hypothetical protein
MIALALCILAAGTAGGQQQAPAGTYRSPGASLRLKPDGNATVSGANGLVSIGSYHIAGDTIAVRDERGAASCGDAPGLYLWRIAADTLRLPSAERWLRRPPLRARHAVDANVHGGTVAGRCRHHRRTVGLRVSAAF